jgi:hypothetical protein
MILYIWEITNFVYKMMKNVFTKLYSFVKKIAIKYIYLKQVGRLDLA